VIEGSVFPRLPLRSLIEHHQRHAAAMTLAIQHENGDRDRNYRTGTPLGMAMLSSDSLNGVPRVGYQDLKEGLIPRLVDAGATALTLPVERAYPRVRDLETYLQGQSLLLEDTIGDGVGVFDNWGRPPRVAPDPGRVWPNVQLIGPVLIGSGAQIGPQAILIGPCVIGPNCIIEEGAVVVGSVIRENCRLMKGCVVRQALVLPGATVESGLELDREIVRGEHA
jgi:NDP-sugar pyrophosphorylase family protein